MVVFEEPCFLTPVTVAADEGASSTVALPDGALDSGGNVTGAGDRLGTIGIEAVSRAWVEQKALTFVEDVLKAN